MYYVCIISGIEITGGLVDNVAESGEESEDEWNYIKVEQKSEVVDIQSLNQSGSIPVDLVSFLNYFLCNNIP